MKIGDKIPEMLGVDANGKEVKASDYAGKRLAIYFYPKDNTFDKRIGRFVKNQRERHVHSVNADVVLNHIVLHKVFAVAWVADVAQSLGD
jgi:peroxiredoxin